MLKCTKYFDFDWGAATNFAGRNYSAPSNPLAGFNGPTFKGGKEGRAWEREGMEEGRKGEGGEGGDEERERRREKGEGKSGRKGDKEGRGEGKRDLHFPTPSAVTEVTTND